MTNVLAMTPNAGDIAAFEPRQIALIRRTVARDCNEDEFRMFIHIAKQMGLDPIRKQIYAFVFNRDNADKRNMSIVTGIDGFRSVASRCGDYRPSDRSAEFEYDENAKGPTNPLGIIRAIVRAYKQDNRGEWHGVIGEAHWDEFAPIKEEWAKNEAGSWRPTGKTYLDTSGNWAKMPRHMIAKCAEAQALRRGWPEQFSNVYEHSEVDRARVIDLDPVDAVNEADRSDRLAKIGHGPSLTFAFDISSPLENVPIGQVADRLFEHVQRAQSSAKLQWFVNNNAEVLRTFWGHEKDAALQVKAAIEARIKDLRETEDLQATE